MSRGAIKKLWDLCPGGLRHLLCANIARFSAGRRQHVPVPDRKGPYFICGAFKNASGLGEGSRLYANELELNGQEVFRIDVTNQMRMAENLPFEGKLHKVKEISGLPEGRTVIIHANPPQFYFVLSALGKKFLARRHIVAFWAWEKNYLPSYWLPAFDYADSFEVPSSFVASVLFPYTNKTVEIHPHKVPMPASQKHHYARDGKLHCLFIFDAGSFFERKNPLGTLEAYRKAFSPGEATLTFKVMNNEYYPEQFESFKQACQKVPGVKILTGVMTREELERLYLENDIYISLHRSEGFGLTIREALNYGLFGVATQFGGNTEFMKEEKVWLIKPKDYQNGYASPDIEEAADALRKLGKVILSGQLSSPCQLETAPGAA